MLKTHRKRLVIVLCYVFIGKQSHRCYARSFGKCWFFKNVFFIALLTNTFEVLRRTEVLPLEVLRLASLISFEVFATFVFKNDIID